MTRFPIPGTALLCLTLGGLQIAMAAGSATTERWGRSPLPRAEDSQRTEAVLFGTDFESGWDGWTTTDLSAIEPVWHPATFNAYAGNSWWSGLESLGGYDNHWLQYLETPAVAISASPAQLSFRLRYATEAPGGEPAGYNAWDGCNVWVSVDGGAWTVATGFSWNYTNTSLYSFGYEFGMGTGIPGWCGTSNWRAVTKDLAAYVGHTVAFRFAFCSDPSYCSTDNAAITGMYVDDVLVTSNGATVLENNADGVATPADFTAISGGASGNTWTLSTVQSHSPTHSTNGAVGDGLNNALVSPVWTLPADQDLWLEFWLRSDMLDSDGNGDTNLEDYYHVEISADGGATWDLLFYDYTDASRPGSTGWEDYLPGLPFNGNIEMSLNEYGGQDVQLRWRLSTDWDNDGGTGSGLWIDDVEVWGSDVPANDLACAQIIPGYPRTVGTPCETFVQFDNNGSSDLFQIQGWMAANNQLDGPILPRMDLPPLSSVTRLYDWTPDLVGENELKSWGANSEDQVTVNDTLWVSPIEVRPAGQFEFGYGYQDPAFFFSGGDPAMLVDEVSTLGLGTLNVLSVSLGLYDPDGTAGGKVIRVHILEDNTGTPGDEIWSGDYTLTTQDVVTLWEFGVEEGVQVTGDFWVWCERLQNYPHALGNDIIWNTGHCAITDGVDFDLSFSDADGSELLLYVLTEADTDLPASPVQPSDFVLEAAVPNPFNPSTQLSFQAPAGTELALSVYNLRGQEVARLFEGQASGLTQSFTFNGGGMASGVYFARLEGEGRVSTQKLVLNK